MMPATPATPSDALCELCEAAEITPWFYEDDVCWIAECEQCWVPMVVWKTHDPNPSVEVRVVLLEKLAMVVATEYGFDFYVDDHMRSIPLHYHAHARPRGGFYFHGLRRTTG